MAAKKKGSGTNGKPQKGKKSNSWWSKNKSDATAKAKKKMEWTKAAAKKKAPGFSETTMTGIDGKKHKYLTRTDSRGRTRIINNGQEPPKGYYGTGRGYFALKKNLRVTDESSQTQKNFVAANRERLYGVNPDGTDIGAIDRMGRGGQIHAEDGIVYVNFRKDATTRREMNKAKAFFENNYFHAGAKKKMSKNIIAFGQDGREP